MVVDTSEESDVESVSVVGKKRKAQEEVISQVSTVSRRKTRATANKK